jgi:hypothetical protein
MYYLHPRDVFMKEKMEKESKHKAKGNASYDTHMVQQGMVSLL